MIRKEYQVQALSSTDGKDEPYDSRIREEILKVIDAACRHGAIVELKILEGVDFANEGKRFSKIRMDIVSNTDFDQYEL